MADPKKRPRETVSSKIVPICAHAAETGDKKLENMADALREGITELLMENNCLSKRAGWDCVLVKKDHGLYESELPFCPECYENEQRAVQMDLISGDSERKTYRCPCSDSHGDYEEDAQGVFQRGKARCER